jgi:hypothetical protein
MPAWYNLIHYVVRPINPTQEAFICGAEKKVKGVRHICNGMAPAGGHWDHRCCCKYAWSTAQKYLPQYGLAGR